VQEGERYEEPQQVVDLLRVGIALEEEENIEILGKKI
jgi:hypothetical protein